MGSKDAGVGMGRSFAAAFTVVAVFALSNAPTPLYVRWQAEWGFSSGVLTVIFAAYIAGLIATLLVAGRIADRHGRRIVLIPGVALAVMSSVLFLVADGVLWLLAARLLAGVAVGTAVTAGMAAVVDLAPPRRYRTASLLASAAMVAGAGFGPLLAGSLTQLVEAPQVWVFALMAAISGGGLVIAWTLPLPTPLPTQRDRGGWRFPVPPARNRRELAWGIATFAPGITATSFVLSLGPSVLGQALDAPSALLAGATASAMFLMATGIQFALVRLPTRTHLLLSSLATIAAMVLLIVAMSAFGSPTLFLAAALLAGAAQGLGQLAGLTLIATGIPAGRRAESNAALNIAGYIPAAALPVATGYLADAANLRAAVVAFAATLTAAALIAAISVRTSTRRHLPTAGE